MQRIYKSDLDLGSDTLHIVDIDTVHQMTKVLRSQLWDLISFFQGDGYEYIYEITRIEKRSITVTFTTKKKNTYAPEKRITLYQALPNKWEKMELIVQKCCEIGVEKIVFFVADRSQMREIPDKKKIRLEKINLEATEQSGRNIPMEILFEEKPTYTRDSIVLSLEGQETKKILPRLQWETKQIHIGPEGWWSEAEELSFQENNICTWYAGNSVMRTETAAICSCFYIMHT